ncbi:MAG: cellulase family glycosylhydrolase [Verrucomicrobiota bacterium]
MVNEAGQEVTLKGCNIGNWLLLEMWMLDVKDVRDQYEFESILAERFGRERKDELMEIYRRNWVTDRDFKLIRSFGFDVIRLPFHYGLLEDDEHPLQLKPDAFKWLDAAVAMAQRHGLYVILDLHGAPGGQSKDHTTGHADQNKLFHEEPYKQRFVWLWEQIATHYKDSPVIAALEPVNEPFGDYESDKHLEGLLEVFDRAYRAIRSVDTNHIVIIPGTQQGLRFYGSPRDRGWENVMFTEHYYQGVIYGQPTLEAHKDLINRTLVWLDSYLRGFQTPLLVGEFNVVFRRAGGPALMREYYDLFASKGWWATMWSYKIISKAGGVAPDNWYMVTNQDPAPPFSVRESSYNDIAAFFHWLGTMRYGIYEDLREALTTDQPVSLELDETISPLAAPAQDALGPWQATDIACEPPGGQRVESPSKMTIFGGGRDLWSDLDEFRFVWQKKSGDFEIEATVEGLSEVNPFAKAGLMIRGGLEANAPHVLIHVFPDSQVTVGWRAAAGGMMEEQKFAVREFPVRLRLKKTGTAVASFSAIGNGDWVEGPAFTFDWLAGECYTGMAVLSHDNRYLARARFDGIKVTPETN